jgi:alanine dehydrogenase
MIVGCPKEIKEQENRVGLVPAGALQLSRRGVRVLVERGAGAGADYDDEEYEKAGATLVEAAAEVFAEADMVVKVKEPLPSELPMLREGQVLLTYLHLAADKALTDALLASGVTGIAYETVQIGHRCLCWSR